MAVARRNCITKLYDVLYHQNPALFGADDDKEAPHVYAYDRVGVFFTSSDMAERDPVYLDNVSCAI